MNQGELPEGAFTQFKQLEHEYIGYQSLTDVPKSSMFKESTINLLDFNGKPIYEIVDALRATDNIYAQCQLWGVLLKRMGPEYEVY